MAQFSGTIPLSDIERIEIYNKKRRNTKAGMKQVMKETGGDIIMTPAIFLRTLKPCCHLKADGKVLCAPNYTAWAIAWTDPQDFCVCRVPAAGKENWMECVHAIIDGKKISPMNYGADMKYKTNRLLIGTKDGRFAYLATQNDLSPEEARDICFNAGWDFCIMMDGGGTTAILFKDGSGFAGDGRYVPFWIVIHLKKGSCPFKAPTTTIMRGSQGEGAKWVQWQLNRHGAGLIVDGIFGTKSVNALKNFQRAAFPNEPKEWDGKCGPKTRKELAE